MGENFTKNIIALCGENFPGLPIGNVGWALLCINLREKISWKVAKFFASESFRL